MRRQKTLRRVVFYEQDAEQTQHGDHPNRKRFFHAISLLATGQKKAPRCGNLHNAAPLPVSSINEQVDYTARMPDRKPQKPVIFRYFSEPLCKLAADFLYSPGVMPVAALNLRVK